MYNQKLWEMLKPVLLDFIKGKKEEMERDGLVPTLQELINQLENE